MAGTTIQTPYSTIAKYAKTTGASFVDEYDAARLSSYDFYDDLYNLDDTTWHLTLRTQDEKPILVPTAKRLCKTMARYIGRDWGYSITSATAAPTPEDPEGDEDEASDGATSALISAAEDAYGALFRRESILSAFHTAKVEWLRRGDWVWYVSANPRKPLGSRLSVRSIDPRTYFPLFDEDDVTRRIGARIIEEVPIVLAGETTTAYKVQEWLKPTHPRHPEWVDADDLDVDLSEFDEISYSSALYKADSFGPDESKWEILRTLSAVEIIEGITQLPLYHLRNNPESENPFGSSELRGLEPLFLGINQAASDEDLSLSMAGLGMYVTDGEPPLNEATGAPEDWILGPGRVVEVAQGRQFTRVQGISSVEPFQTHIRFLELQAYGTAGVSDVALGSIDAKAGAAVSGVALAIRLQPLFDAAIEKDRTINDIMGNLLYDLREWFKVYEDLDLTGVDVVSVTTVDNALPVERAARWNEILTGYSAGLFSLEFVVSILRDEFGYDVDPGAVDELAEEARARMAADAAAVDPYGARLNLAAD